MHCSSICRPPERILFVPVGFSRYGDDHSLVLDALSRRPDILRGTSLFYPSDPHAPHKLRELVAKQPLIISTRFHAHRGKENYLESFRDEGVRAIWRTAVELGLIIELHIGPSALA
jgi:predicted TIM-barrel fold metal-dependent hydrolase